MKNKVDNKATKTASSKEEYNKNTWYVDSYNSVLIQRNFFILIFFICVLVITLSIVTIRYIKNTQTIEPFVIEIEQKSGVPTVIKPLDVKEYSANVAVKESLIVQYIKARESYSYYNFFYNYYNVVKVMSSPQIYYGQYRPIFGPQNKNSPYNILNKNGTIEIKFKSIVFQTPDTAQVRVYLDSSGSFSGDKIILISFSFENITLSETERYINPLGFVVKSYQIANENIK
ncbi:VirB8 family type IV secretion system protein [Lyticum sinuosum]|uniref:Type IV secretion system protein VirB8 n=1 Tax=Lyticum sinuosum TaxID=1332059 RepID=A0AAE4VKE2_9RICK|nr:type IV secretion system protein [Lyticum sinuosum]MDZ5760958.1 Type IV secretion system protein VirB8 [Lyticum sinuosum]